MNLFYERRKKVRAELDFIHDTEFYKKLSHHEQVKFNCQFMLNAREGDYLIKVSRKNKKYYCGEYNLYVGFSYVGGDGWMSLLNRRRAQWFTGKEAQEWIRNCKGFTIVKK